MKGMNKFTTVFAFTFRRQTGTRGWRSTTILLALLLFLLPALLPTLLDDGDAPSEARPDAPFADAEDSAADTAINRLLIVDETPGEADWSVVALQPQPELVACTSLEAAAQEATPKDLILRVTMEPGNYTLSLLEPDECSVGLWIDSYSEQLAAQFPAIQLQKSGLAVEELAGVMAELSAPVQLALQLPEEADPNDALREMLQMVLPYATVMLLYFMVLFYGQSVATSAIAEKSSKLMDTFLVSVKPQAMMLGKVLAVSLAAVIQLAVWILALGGGFVAGAALLRAVNPDSTSGFLAFVDAFGTIGGLFTPAGIAVAVALMLSGFLLYCGLAAVGGALASKPEELSSTNLLFTMALVISFFACLFGGGMMGEEGITLGWLDWVPFTAILATPSRVLLGQISPLLGLASLAIVLVTAVLVCLLAGKVYTMMSFYRGAPPKPQDLLKLLRRK